MSLIVVSYLGDSNIIQVAYPVFLGSEMFQDGGDGVGRRHHNVTFTMGQCYRGNVTRVAGLR